MDGDLSNVPATSPVANTDVSASGWDGIPGADGHSTASAGFRQLEGSMVEVNGISGPVTQTEVTDLEQYLMTRYWWPWWSS